MPPQPAPERVHERHQHPSGQRLYPDHGAVRGPPARAGRHFLRPRREHHRHVYEELGSLQQDQSREIRDFTERAADGRAKSPGHCSGRGRALAPYLLGESDGAQGTPQHHALPASDV